VDLKPDATRFGMNLPAFENVPGQHTRYTSADGRYREDFAEWRLPNDAIAGLTLSVAANGKPFTDPPMLGDIPKIWPEFNDMHPSFGQPASAATDLGTIAYLRAAIGTRACVLFIQRWPAAEPRIATNGPATLSGFYCNPPGTLLPPDAALAVLRAVVLRPPLKQS